MERKKTHGGQGGEERKLWQKPKVWIAGGTALSLILVLIALTVALSGSGSVERVDSEEMAPNLVLADTSGQQFELLGRNGNLRLLYFSYPG